MYEELQAMQIIEVYEHYQPKNSATPIYKKKYKNTNIQKYSNNNYKKYNNFRSMQHMEKSKKLRDEM